MSFDFAADMDAIFLASGFEENIVYNGATIKAVVDRGDLTTLGQSGFSGGANLTKYKVTIQVSKTDIPAAVVRSDTVVVSHHGRTNDTLLVTAIISEDDGAYTLGLS